MSFFDKRISEYNLADVILVILLINICALIEKLIISFYHAVVG